LPGAVMIDATNGRSHDNVSKFAVGDFHFARDLFYTRASSP
jgi:hypothetical protein